MSGNLDELPVLLTQLRELVREAHGVTKDLRAAIKEARDYADSMVKIVDAAADSARTAAYKATESQLTEFEEHIQSEMNRSAADLNAAVETARQHIARALRPKIAALSATGEAMLVEFEGNLFDAHVGEPV